jgi:hypothetical protein
MTMPEIVLKFQNAPVSSEGEGGKSAGEGKADFRASVGIVSSAEIKLAMIFMIARELAGIGLKRYMESLRGNLRGSRRTDSCV